MATSFTFSDLYGDLLDRELGSADRTQRFTTARRKAAVNQGQMEWVRLTECLPIDFNTSIVDAQQEYNLRTLISSNKFMRFASRLPYVKIVTSAGATTYIQGDDFKRKDVESLDRSEGGWRQTTGSRPQSWYMREDDKDLFFGLYPKPKIPAGDTWTLFIPYIEYPDAMSADGDIPWNGKQSLIVFQQAIVHYAAAQLEKLRRNYSVSSSQLDAFLAYVHDFLGVDRETSAAQVEFAHNYFDAASIRPAAQPDPKRWP